MVLNLGVGTLTGACKINLKCHKMIIHSKAEKFSKIIQIQQGGKKRSESLVFTCTVFEGTFCAFILDFCQQRGDKK